MFAVPGWSVSSDGLKAETIRSSNGGGASEDSSAAAAAAGPTSKNNKSRKRKRAAGAAAVEVTAANVADLFESIVEGKAKAKGGDNKDSSSSKKRGKNKNKNSEDDTIVKEDQTVKKQKKNDGAAADPPSKKDGGDKKKTERDDTDQDTAAAAAPGSKEDKKQRQKQKQKQQQQDDKTADKSPAPATTIKPEQLVPAPPKLTPLQASMRQKLISARFRHLNETLYTRPSEEAYALFQDSPEMFDEYHEGFRRQVKAWPENPVDSFLADIRRRGKVRAHGRGGGNGKANGKDGRGGRPQPQPLPRTQGTCTIADLGCGDARLAESLGRDGGKLGVQVLSYDLQSPSPLVTRADIANLPLEDGSVNVAVFCLALMGTNWVDFVEEAYRILHWKGELWVAEIKSRFAGPARGRVEHSVGHRTKNGKGPAASKAKGRGAADDADDADDGQDLAVEVDGADDRRRETDVSAFVDVLRRRGFVLDSAGDQNDAVDLSNRMFVKMHFVKAADPTKGKGVKPRSETAARGPAGNKDGRTPRQPPLHLCAKAALP
ncbi:ribosomal RNA-processing protein 8 [Geosmithia morbida]|uniref:Ribosomal RNA-processing protein 8 n=1 Tax=Geosmithia morbida TaxID=1094350 RepID=A0A9P4Z133_9HYPO|nr:ribosomal RNA-processing protein 8 [Geosmithia morbida]KAF4126758.1 ribosomal RNA-processing protein 8 [Geosmithia morbida]